MEVLEAADFNSKNNFIAGWFIDNQVCDNLINYYERSNLKEPGLCFNKGELQVDSKIKECQEVGIGTDNQDPEILEYYVQLQKVCEEYKKMYKYCDTGQARWQIIKWNIQKYNPNQAFYAEHTERNNLETSPRHLVFMTYLNDINDQGETEFIHQKMKVKPRKGLTLIWGADWTFLHKGLASPSETKYITTGWYEYVR